MMIEEQLKSDGVILAIVGSCWIGLNIKGQGWRLVMHILIIHQAAALLDEPGGTRHHELARYLVHLGHRVTILTGQVSYLTGDSTVGGGFIQRMTDDAGVDIVRCYCLRGWHRSFIHRTLSSLSFMISSSSPASFKPLAVKSSRMVSFLKK